MDSEEDIFEAQGVRIRTRFALCVWLVLPSNMSRLLHCSSSSISHTLVQTAIVFQRDCPSSPLTGLSASSQATPLLLGSSKRDSSEI